jgi:hypothetical protein
MTTTAARPKAAPPAPPPPKYRPQASAVFTAPLALQTKRHEAFAEEAAELAAQYGWEGEPTWTLNDISVADATNFIQKTLHEAHVSHCNDHLNPPDYAVAAEHLGLSGDDVQTFIAALTAAHDREHIEVETMSNEAFDAKTAANRDEDHATRDRIRTAYGLSL